MPEASRIATAVPSRPIKTAEIAPELTNSPTFAPVPMSTATARSSLGGIIFVWSKKTSSTASEAVANIAPLLFISSAMAWSPKTRTRATALPSVNSVGFAERNVFAVILPWFRTPPSSVTLENETAVASKSSKRPEVETEPWLMNPYWRFSSKSGSAGSVIGATSPIVIGEPSPSIKIAGAEPS